MNCFRRHLSAPRLASLLAFSTLSLGALASPISGNLQFSVLSNYSDTNQQLISDLQSDGGSWGATPASLTASATAHGHVTVFGSGSASWAPDGTAGSMTMDYGWSAPAGVDGGAGTAAANGANWTYSFLAEVDGFFILNYDIVASGVSNFSRFGLPYFGLQGYDIYQTAGDSSGLHNVSLLGFDPTTTGQYVQSILAGTVYSFSVRNGGNLGGMGVNQGHGADVDTDVSVHAEFNWTVAGIAAPDVPEATSTVALLALGLAMASLASRRFRRIQAA